MKNEDIALGDRYKNRNGLIGTVTKVNGVYRLIVCNAMGDKIQSIRLKDIEIKKFKKVV